MKRFLLGSSLVLGSGLFLAQLAPQAVAAPPGQSSSYADMSRMEEESLSGALAWLARHQEADGSWKATGDPKHGFDALYEPDAAKSCDVMATSLALLAFVSDSSNPWQGKYQEAVKRGFDWLRARQKANGGGCFESVEDIKEGGTQAERQSALKRGHLARMNHLWASVASLEIVGSAEFDNKTIPVADAEKMRRRLEAMPVAAAALKYIVEDVLTKPARFDFLNEKTINMDEIALLSACRYLQGKLAINVEKDWFEGVGAALTQVQNGQPEAMVPYRHTEEGEYWFGGSISTPQSMIAYVYLFKKGNAANNQMKACAPILLAHPPAWNPYYEIGRPARHPEASVNGMPKGAPAALPDSLKDVAGVWRDDIANEASWFWQGMAFRSFAAVDATSANLWRQSFLPMAWEHQRRSGPEAGSWDPLGPHARVFGREISTAWMAITLEGNCRLQMGKSTWQDLKFDPRWNSRKENLDKGAVVKVKCTVCDMEIMSNTPYSKGEGATVYYFCTEDHQMKFEMNPEAYRDGKKPPEGEGSEGSHK